MMSDDLKLSDCYGYTVDPEAELQRDEKERWRCTDDDAASWVLRKLGETEAELAAKREQLQAENDRLNRWIEEVTAPLIRSRDFFDGTARRYAEERYQVTGVKTVKLPTGELTARKAPDRLEVDDEERFIAWAVANERRDLLRVKVEVDAKAAKAALEPVAGEAWYAPATGEVALGVEWTDDDSVCRVVHWDGEVVDAADEAHEWVRVPEGALIVPAPLDEAGALSGPARVVPGVTLVIGEVRPGAKAAQL